MSKKKSQGDKITRAELLARIMKIKNKRLRIKLLKIYFPR